LLTKNVRAWYGITFRRLMKLSRCVYKNVAK
jgi:hypothetical protein